MTDANPRSFPEAPTDPNFLFGPNGNGWLGSTDGPGWDASGSDPLANRLTQTIRYAVGLDDPTQADALAKITMDGLHPGSPVNLRTGLLSQASNQTYPQGGLLDSVAGNVATRAAGFLAGNSSNDTGGAGSTELTGRSTQRPLMSRSNTILIAVNSTRSRLS